MAGYTRQSVADILNGSEITAPPINAEFNQLVAAFNGSTGHSHDGTTGNAPKIDLTTSLSGYLPAAHGGVGGKNKLDATSAPATSNDNTEGYAPGSIWENVTNGRVYICVGNGSNAAVWRELVTVFTNNKIEPAAHNTIDLGTPTVRFQDIYLQGGSVIAGNSSFGGTLTVAGASTLDSLTVTNATTLNGAITLGDSSADLLGFNARLTTSIVPQTTNTVDLGTSTEQWRNLYIDGTANIDILVADTADINGGTIDGTAIGATTASTGEFTTVELSSNLSVTGTSSLTGDVSMAGALAVTGNTTGSNISASGTLAATGDTTLANLSATGTSTLTTVDINGGAIDGTTIGASSHTTGKFTTLQSTGLATLNSVNIDGGSIDGTTIGATTTSSGAFTTVSASGGFTGALTGNVTGNVTGDLTGDVTGDVTGNLTGNVTSSGSSSFNNVTIDGTLNMNAGTTATITNLTSPTNTNDAATKGYVDTQVANLVDSAPGTLDTLNELAAALGDDPDFATTVTDSIATKLPLAGGTMTGAIAMGTSKITGLGDPTAAQDAATKNYVDTQDALQVTKSGDSMSGNLAMGSNNITGLATPTANDHATNKSYVDGILGSATAAAASAAAAATSETNAATSESNAATSASAAAASYDAFDDRYLGAKSTAPTTDNDGDVLSTGALYFNTTDDEMYVWNGSTWYNVNPDLVNDNTPQLGGDLQSNGFDIDMADNDKVTFGNSQDLRIFHDGSNSYVQDSGTGRIYLKANDGVLIQGNNNDTLGRFIQDGAVELYHDGDKKLETTSTGVDITGTLTSDGLNVDGNDAGRVTLGQFTNTRNQGGTEAAIALRNQATGNADVSLVAYRTGANFGSDFYIETSDGVDGTNRKRLNVGENGDIQFYNSDGSAAKFHWDAADERLGLGTTTPNSPLDIQASTSGTQIRLTYPSVRTWNAGVQSGGQFAIRDANAAADRMVINNVGNAGIGTGSPNYKLVVSNNGAAGIEFGPEYATDTNLVQHYDRTATAYMDVNTIAQNHRFGRGLDEWMRITNTGAVGIGTDNPLNPLHVSKSKSNAVVSYFNNTDTADGHGILVRGGGTNSLKYVASFEDAAANTRMKILANGNVGIGTGSPTYTLDVEDSHGGFIKASFVSTGSTHSSIVFDNTGSSANSVRVGSQNNDFYIRTSGTEKVRVTSDGEVKLESNSALHTDSTDTSATTQTAVYSFSATDYTGAKFLVCVTDSTATERYITEVLVTHDDTTAVATEYGQVATDTALATFDVDISGGNVRLLATPTSANSMTFKVMSTQLLA